MKLLMSPPSPYARKVRVLIREAGQREEVEEIAVTTSLLDSHPDVAAAHPTRRIPVLLRDDGRPIHDSRVITRYLDDLWDAGFYPGARLWDVLTLEATAEGMIDSSLAMSYEMRMRPEDKQWEGWLDAHWGKIAHALDMIEADWTKSAPGALDMGQIALGCALGHVDFRHGVRDWRRDHPAIAEWFAALSERASMVATRPA